MVRKTGWPARRLSRTARQAVGYREVIDHLESRRSLSETVGLVQQHTRQLAKRQCTWFRSLSECRFVAISGQHQPSETAELIAKAVDSGKNELNEFRSSC